MVLIRNRRKFLKQSAIIGIGAWAHGGIAVCESKAANEQINIACIGVGGKGSGDTNHAGLFGNIVALCDVDEGILNAKGEQFERAKRYFDFRKMFDDMGDRIDAVTVSTPDHTHAIASLRALKMGKHVYCQKPLAQYVWEAREMRRVAEQMKVCTQMGNQGTAADGLRVAVEAVRKGIVGQVKEVHVWTDRPVWPQSPKIVARPQTADPVPPGLHWNEWIGPARFRDYHQGDSSDPKRGTYHRFNWRGWWEFGTGALGDMGCHTANMAFMALDLGYPSAIVAENEPLNLETYPGWAQVTYEFPARDSRMPVKFVWYEGTRDGTTKVLPRPELVPGAKKTEKGLAIFFENSKWMFRDEQDNLRNIANGSFLVGDKAVLFSPDDSGTYSYVVADSGAIERVGGVPQRMPSNNKGDEGMKREWIAAIKANRPEASISNFQYAGMLTEAILLGNVAMRAGKRLEWDGPNLKFKNASDADQYLKREYRSGWTA